MKKVLRIALAAIAATLVSLEYPLRSAVRTFD